MKRFKFRPSFVVPFILTGTLLTGCGDAIFSETNTPEIAAGEHEFSKLRHDHLLRAKFLSRTKVLERYTELAVSNDFVLGMSSLVLEPLRVLERYEQMDGVRIKRSYNKVFNGFAVYTADAAALLALVEADPDIDWIEPDMRFKQRHGKAFKDNLNRKQTVPAGVQLVGGTESWTISGDNQGTVDGVAVFILDTGIEHSDLNIVESVNFADDDPVPSEIWEHGTHVAGTIGAIDDRDDLVGVAPGVGIHALRILNNEGEAELSAAIAAVEYITEQKLSSPETPMVVNISLGAEVGTTEYNALDDAIEASIAAGVVYVVASGNDNIDASTVTPAHVAGAITVSAIDGSNKQVTNFTNYGSLVDIFAPGVNIKSLGWNSDSPLQISGTSMATPHVTGAVALYLAINPQTSPAEAVAALFAASDAENQVVKQGPAGTTKRLLWVGASEYVSAVAPTEDSTSGGGNKGPK